MKPSFNTAGPCIPGEHYMLPPERRIGRVLELIEDHKYFTLHASWQTGKTTSLMWLQRHLNSTGRWRALWVDMQGAREQPDPARAFRTILGTIDEACATVHPELSRPSQAEIAALLESPAVVVARYLSRLSANDPRPLVVLFDAADGLVGEAMVSFLTQIRYGYIERSQSPFPASVVLVGQRQVRDYVPSQKDPQAPPWRGTTLSFNISVEATTLRPFTEDEVSELCYQHTVATGQRFEPDAVARIYELGQGHPWLTNALADQIVDRDVRDRSVPVTAAHVDAAKETIIVERRSHLDALAARLYESQVQRVIAPMLTGSYLAANMLDEDVNYVMELGLARLHHGALQIANPVYQELIPRVLTFIRQGQIANEPSWYVRGDSSLDMDKLIADWQVFWREYEHIAVAGSTYREAGPHLMFLAFLQRIVNGSGRIEREYGFGRGALDLTVFWQEERHAIELKLRRATETEEDALERIARYLDRAGLAEGWLVMFDLRNEVTWEERLFVREAEHAGKRIRIIGC